jgi:beta-lactam-binding protein with PASTA domain
VTEQKAPDHLEAIPATELEPAPEFPTAGSEPSDRAPTFTRSVSRVFRLTLLALVLVLVALVSALTAMRIAIHGREVEVPKLTGLTPLEAEAALFDRGLRLEVENRFYGAEIPEGHVLSQSPVAGTLVRRGWRVRVAESLGAPRAAVPNVIGQSSRAAEINVRRRGLEVGKAAVVHLPNLANDQVVAMSPPPDTMGSSPRVSLLLTATEDSQAMLMPNLVGKRLSDVEKMIGQLGLRLGKANAKAPASPVAKRSEVISKQSPTAGSKVSPGAIVSLQLAH